MEYLKLTEAKEKYECRPVFEVLIGERLRQVWSTDLSLSWNNGKI